MAAKTNLNARNLEALGAERLAQLLFEISTGDAVAKRRLRLALAGAQSPRAAAQEIAKRLTSIARARSVITWENRKALITDLEAQRRAIVEQVAPTEPDEALTLMWRFMALVTPLMARCDDSSGTVIGIFQAGCADLGRLAATVRPDPRALAGTVLAALDDNEYGQYDGLIGIMAPALGDEGLKALKAMVEELGRTPVPVPPEEQRRAIGWGAGGPIYQHEIETRARKTRVAMALQDIADAEGDVDGFAAQYDEKTRTVPQIAADIAQRLLAAGRAGEALETLDRAKIDAAPWVPPEWQDARIAALEALGRGAEAQAFRWACFERSLARDHLRAFLKRLPDFDDVAAEERAMAHAMAHPDVLGALHFFLDWPAPARAAALVVARHDEMDGDYYEDLVAAAAALSERYPLAATLVLRAMVDFALTRTRVKRYRHAAGHLLTCAGLARGIADFGAFETHDAYVARLKEQHGRKHGFWSLIAE